MELPLLIGGGSHLRPPLHRLPHSNLLWVTGVCFQFLTRNGLVNVLWPRVDGGKH